MTTPADIISTARDVYNDADTVLLRKSDEELLTYFNEGLREMSVLQPAIFTSVCDYLCIADEVECAILFTEVQAVVKVLCIHNGAALTYFDMDSMQAFRPGWRTDTAGPAVQWSRNESDPKRFYIYPKAPATAQNLDVLCVMNPTFHALTDTITEVPSGYFPALVDFVIFRAESSDDEHSNSGRATSHGQAFEAKVKGA